EYRKSLRKAGIAIDESLIVTGDSMYCDGFSVLDGYEAMQKLLERPKLAEACFCASDIQAIGAMKAMREMDIRITVIGYDDITISDYIGLSTVRQPMYQMGKLATQMLIQHMEDEGLKPTQTIFSPELILRSSTEAYT